MLLELSSHRQSVLNRAKPDEVLVVRGDTGRPVRGDTIALS